MKTHVFLAIALCCGAFNLSSQISFNPSDISDPTNVSIEPRHIHLADLDGDEDLDLISIAGKGVEWRENIDGLGNYGPIHLISDRYRTDAEGLFTEDIDMDGDMDIIVHSGSRICVFINLDGLGNFSNCEGYNFEPLSHSDFNLIDYDSDGDLDFVSIATYQKAIILYQNLDNVFSDPIVIYQDSTLDFFNECVITDFDRDNDYDFINVNENLELILIENDNGVFSSNILFQLNNPTTSIKLSDFDNDGDEDIYYSDRDTIFLLEQLSNETFNPIYNFPVTKPNNRFTNLGDDNLIDFELVDLDGNNYEDIVFSSSNRLGYYLNNRGFGSAEILNSKGYEFSDFDIGDINGDDKQDLLVASFWDSKIYSYTYQNLNVYEVASISYTYTTPQRLEATDMDHDGDLDLLINSSYLVNYIGWFNNSNNDFEYDRYTEIYDEDYSFLVTADIDNDDNLDLIFKDVTYQLPPTFLVLKDLNGEGTYEKLDTITGIEGHISAMEDINGDGLIDIISHKDGLLWYRNIDGSNFEMARQIDTNSVIGFLVFADQDNDGDLDLISNLDSNLYVKLNDGQGNFVPMQLDAPALPNNGFEILDFDNDGDVDFVSRNNQKEFIWYENTLTTIEPRGIFLNANLNINYYKFKDLDNDGAVDLVFSGSQGLYWSPRIQGIDNFYYGEPQTINNLNRFNYLLTEDLNGDGLIDIASINSDRRIIIHENLGITKNIINGKLFYDQDGNGCDSSDIAISNRLVQTMNDSFLIMNSTLQNGCFSAPVGQGSFITSPFNLPEYFDFAPNFVQNTFNSIGETKQADFCITSNQEIADLSVVILPLNSSRPGFKTSYQIHYKNLGTQNIDGNIDFNFDAAKVSFNSASDLPVIQTTNSLQFEFFNLQAFESRIINLEFRVAAPPTTNIDDVLYFIANINPSDNDVTPSDNSFDLYQTVIGSFDPNDITVLEGNSILISEIDNYLHYLVRFQNTGTASAINVRLENQLPELLDLNTLEILSASHHMEAQINESNKATFYFNQINLPDSLSNELASHGFVSYRIKPKSEIIVGNIILNEAEIYFDFNPPIYTNKASTEVIELTSSNDENVDDTFMIQPNPVKDWLHIETEKNIESSVLVDYTGKQLRNFGSDNSIDLSNLSAGTYFLTVTGIQKVKTFKIVKQ